jgi:hypothetical protein
VAPAVTRQLCPRRPWRATGVESGRGARAVLVGGSAEGAVSLAVPFKLDGARGGPVGSGDPDSCWDRCSSRREPCSVPAPSRSWTRARHGSRRPSVPRGFCSRSWSLWCGVVGCGAEALRPQAGARGSVVARGAAAGRLVPAFGLAAGGCARLCGPRGGGWGGAAIRASARPVGGTGRTTRGCARDT